MLTLSSRIALGSWIVREIWALAAPGYHMDLSTYPFADPQEAIHLIGGQGEYPRKMAENSRDTLLFLRPCRSRSSF